jgi:hypothetical protein
LLLDRWTAHSEALQRKKENGSRDARRKVDVTASGTIARRFVLMCVAIGALTLGGRQANAQTRDGLLNGAVIGGAVGATVGVAFTHAVRDSDLTFGQYSRGALVFGVIGAGVGLGVDALLNRAPNTTRRQLFVAPNLGRDMTSVAVSWRW